MNSHFTLRDEEFEKKLSDATLDPSLFNHEAHLRLAWIHIRRYGIEKAMSNIRVQLKRYTASLGSADKYNETVTVAAVKAVYHFILKSDTELFSDFVDDNPRLKTNFRDLMNSHYETDIFKSDKARKKFIEPELLPFDI